LAKRDDNADGTWGDAGATLDTGTNTLTKTGETGTEYILGSTSGDNSLPVSLSSFTGAYRDGKVILEWVTESELGNLGFILERQIKGTNSWRIIANYQTDATLRGQGNTSSRTEYTFTDNIVEHEKEYLYRLSDVSMTGEITQYAPISITLKNLVKTSFMENAYPNPFNPKTYIAYNLAEPANVNISVFDLQGRQIKTLFKGHQPAGNYHIYWDGLNENGSKVPSGNFIIRMQAENSTQIQKVMLIK
jgi:hypothetical protein